MRCWMVHYMFNNLKPRMSAYFAFVSFRGISPFSDDHSGRIMEYVKAASEVDAMKKFLESESFMTKWVSQGVHRDEVLFSNFSNYDEARAYFKTVSPTQCLEMLNSLWQNNRNDSYAVLNTSTTLFKILQHHHKFIGILPSQ